MGIFWLRPTQAPLESQIVAALCSQQKAFGCFCFPAFEEGEWSNVMSSAYDIVSDLLLWRTTQPHLCAGTPHPGPGEENTELISGSLALSFWCGGTLLLLRPGFVLRCGKSLHGTCSISGHSNGDGSCPSMHVSCALFSCLHPSHILRKPLG